MTTLDYPDHLACVVFLQGCPLRCGYCHNPQMLEPRKAKPDEWAEIEAFLDRRRGLLDGVVLSGGEPMLHADLPLAAARVRALGFRVGLHTAGVYPRRLKALLPWRDWTLASLRDLALSLSAQGVTHYAIQMARPQQCLEEAYTQPVTTAPTTAELHDLVHRLQPAFQYLELREGVV